MIRLGIIGSENSHADSFASHFTNAELYPDIKAIGVAGDYPESNVRINEKFGIPIFENYLDMIGAVDAVAITSRDGATHAGFARPFIEAGIPVFLDKPFCSDAEEAKALVKLAMENKVPIFGGSMLKLVGDTLELARVANDNLASLRAGYLSAPVSMNNQWGGFYFYSAHLVEMCLTIFGYDPIEVSAQSANDCVSAIVRYPGFDVTLQFVNESYSYFGQVFYGGKRLAKDISLSNGAEEIGRLFAEMLRTGQMPYTYAQLVKPVYFLNAIHESYTTGKAVKIGDLEA